MKSSFLFVLISVFLCTSAKSQTIVEGGEVYGTWNTAGSPYQVSGEIYLPAGQMLTIEPGVRIHFQGHHRFFVYGTLMALGTVSDSIYITVENDTTEWCGIEFKNPVQNVPRSLLEYCVIEHSYAYSGLSEPFTSNYDEGGGILADYGNLTIRNCAIRNNKALIGAGIKTGGNTVIKNTRFTNNRALGKDILYIANGVNISGCLIADNRASENIVRILQDVLFLNNTVTGNVLDSTGIAIAMTFGDPDLVNSIIYGNNVSLIHVTLGSNPRFYNCDIEGGIDSVFAYGFDNDGAFPGIYENNLNALPVFLDAANGNYQLEESSPCIDAGSYLTWNPNLLTDLSGEPRIAAIGKNVVDMGAYEFQGPAEIEDTATRIPPARSLIDIKLFPNPVSEELYIESNSNILEYSIMDLQGRIIMQGIYTDRIQVTDLSDGQFILSATTNSGIVRRLFLKL